VSTLWDLVPARDALVKRQRREAEEQFSRLTGPCPNCGAPAEVDMIDVSTHAGDLSFLPGLARCAWRCYDRDPEGYIEAVRALAVRA
jgi:hypothetical protein